MKKHSVTVSLAGALSVILSAQAPAQVVSQPNQEPEHGANLLGNGPSSSSTRGNGPSSSSAKNDPNNRTEVLLSTHLGISSNAIPHLGTEAGVITWSRGEEFGASLAGEYRTDLDGDGRAFGFGFNLVGGLSFRQTDRRTANGKETNFSWILGVGTTFNHRGNLGSFTAGGAAGYNQTTTSSDGDQEVTVSSTRNLGLAGDFPLSDNFRISGLCMGGLTKDVRTRATVDGETVMGAGDEGASAGHSGGLTFSCPNIQGEYRVSKRVGIYVGGENLNLYRGVSDRVRDDMAELGVRPELTSGNPARLTVGVAFKAF